MNYKTVVSLTLILTMLVCSQAAYAIVVDIPDPNLEALIRETIGKPEGDITDADLQGITILNSEHDWNTPEEEKIADPTGLEYCTNLTSLNLRYNQISDISSLASLTGLTYLNLGSNQISDISSLANLTSLTDLYLHVNLISDISSLANLTSLTELSLSSNPISDISSLANLTSLTHLSLESNQISDISSLANLTSLTYLYLSSNLISDISSLANLTSLTHLSLHSNQISDISSLANLTNLPFLVLSSNPISDISSLANLTSLTHLSLESNQISDIQPLVDNSGISGGDLVALHNNPLNYNSQKTLIPTLEGRGVDVDYRAKGVVTLDSSGPPTWSYTLTRQYGWVYNWFYEGAGITGASVTGEAEAAGWTVEYTSTLVTFSNSTPMTSGSVSGFEITGDQGGTGSWFCGRNSDDIEGALPVELLSFTAMTDIDSVTINWRTATETNNLGFNVYRSETKDGKYIKVNTRLIAGSGSDATPHDYSFTDDDVVLDNTYYYYIEDVDFAGKKSKSPILRIRVGQESEVKVIDQPNITMRPKLKPVAIPTEFALLQNYPNPFNPETWIPFYLAKDVPVTISIYNTKGQQIRTLYLGNRTAGIYTTKDRAAYWDGRNKFGQKVASDIYYYTIEAGEFRATKRMVVVK